MPVPLVSVPGLPVKISKEPPIATWDSQVGAAVVKTQRRWLLATKRLPWWAWSPR